MPTSQSIETGHLERLFFNGIEKIAIATGQNMSA